MKDRADCDHDDCESNGSVVDKSKLRPYPVFLIVHDIMKNFY